MGKDGAACCRRRRLWLAALAQGCPQLLLPFCSVSPRSDNYIQTPGAALLAAALKQNSTLQVGAALRRAAQTKSAAVVCRRLAIPNHGTEHGTGWGQVEQVLWVP